MKKLTIDEDIQIALEILKTEGKEAADGRKECEFCDSSVGHICESCFLVDVILRLRNKISKLMLINNEIGGK